MLFTERGFRGILLKVLHPILVWAGKTRVPYSIKMVTGQDYLKAESVIQPGMVFLTRTFGELSTAIIPGYWKHVAIYVGEGKVVEAVGQGVRVVDVISFMLSKDQVMLLDPLFATPEMKIYASTWAMQQVGKPYDYEFQSSYQSFYCAELAYAAYEEASKFFNHTGSDFKLKPTLGEETVVPDDFALAKDKWKQVFESGNPE